jgi:outer membrane murein-binding lipoprotein Lpp
MGFFRSGCVGAAVLSILPAGCANQTQLDGLASLSRALVVFGKTDLVAAFRNARGYN